MADKSIYKKVLKIFIPVWAILILVSAVFYRERQHDIRVEVLDEQKTACSMVKNVVEDDLRSLFSALNLLSADPMVTTLLSLTGPEQEETAKHVSHNYLRLMRNSDCFDQLRVIDRNGTEAVRVNYNEGKPAITSPTQLQHKGHRYYFRDTIKLTENEFYVSPFDLNIEHGVLELPIKPMIRIGSPIVDASGRNIGIVMINFLGRKLIDKIVKYARTEDAHTELINAEGYWLKAENPENEWGFMYPDRRDVSFSKRFPDAWKK